MYTSEGTGPRRAPSPLLARPSAPAPPPSLHAPRPARGEAVLLACTRYCTRLGACAQSSAIGHFSEAESSDRSAQRCCTNHAPSKRCRRRGGRRPLPAALSSGAARCSASESPGARSQEWCRANGAECLAVQAPGRLLRGREAPLTRAVDVAAALLPVLAPRLRDGVPYAVRASETSPTPRLPSQGRFTGQCCLHMRPCGQAPAESRVMSWQCTLDKVQAPSSTTPHRLTAPGNGRRRLQAACACG